MKTLLKAAAALAVLGLLAALAAPLLLKRFLPPEKVRELVVREASKALRREVRLDAVSWSLLKGLSMEGLSVSEAPDFKAGTFAEARGFRVRPGWRALLRGKLVVNTVSLEGLRLSVARTKPGPYNFSDLAGSTAPAAGGAAAPAALPFALSVSRARLSDGSVTYRDPAAKTELTLSGIEAEVRDFSLDGPFTAELAFKAAGRHAGAPVEAAFAYAGRLDPGAKDPSKATAEFEKLRLEAKGLKVEASGKVTGLERPAFDLAFAVSRDKAELVSGQAVGSAEAPAGGGPTAAFRFKARSPGFSGAALKELGAPAALRVPRGAASGAVDYRGESLVLTAVRLEADQGFVTAAGTVSALGAKRPVADLDLAADLKLPELRAEDLPVAGLPKGLVIPATEVKAKARLKGEDLSLESLALKDRFGTLSASGKVRGLLAAKPDVDLDAAFDLDLPAFKDSDLPWAGLPKGLSVPALKLKGRSRLQGETATIPALSVRTAAGSAEVSGAVRKALSAKPEPELSVTAKLSLPAFTAADLPFAPLPAGFWAPAATVSGTLRTKGKDLELDGLELGSKAGTVKVSGKVKGALGEKPEPELDVTAKLELPPFKTDDFAWAGAPAGLAVPASKVDAALWASLDEARIRSVRLIVGKNDVELDGGKVVQLRSPSPLFNLLVKCRSFALEEFAVLSPEIKEMGLTGSGFFAVGITGRLPKPILEGKAQFKGLGATVAGLKLADFTGTVTMNEKRLDIPNLKGKLADGELAMDLTVKEYATRPDVDLAAELTQFDMGAFLKAKAAVVAPKAGAPAEPAAAAKPVPPVDLKGRFVVGRLLHDNAEAKDLRVDWELTGATPDLKSLGGTAKLHSGNGKFTDLGKMATQSKVVKVLVMPVLLFQKIGRIGGVRLFPDFNNVTYSELSGSYRFENGVMTLEDSRILSDAFNIVAQGKIDLPAETQDLLVTAQVGSVAPIDVEVKGTFDKPSSKPKIGQFLKNIIIKK